MRKMKALKLRPRPLDRMPWKITDRAGLAEETMSQWRKETTPQTGDNPTVQHDRRWVIDASSSEIIRNLGCQVTFRGTRGA